MQEKFLKVWEEIEEAIGICCLHKKAAFMEVAGKSVQQLTLVTSAPTSVILNFIGERKVDDKQKNRFLFAHNGIQVDLTTYCDVEDVDELYRKSFRHSLTIDSIGVRRDGMVSSSYNGIEDIHNKILRLTDENSAISEGLYRRILLMHAYEGYSLDDALSGRLEREKFFQKEGYRKKFCEIFVSGVRAEKPNWFQVAKLLGMPGCTLSHKSAFVAYAENIGEADEKFKRTFIFLIMALLKVTSRELQSLMAGIPEMEYYDSLCANLTTKVDTQDALRRIKGKYGDEFVELLYDLQELWMKDIEGVPFRRYTERDFDKMGLVVSDGNLWFDRNNPVKIQKTVEAELPSEPEEVDDILSEEDDDTIEMVGSPEYAKLMQSGYVDESYSDDEPTEGIVVDNYEMPVGEESVPSTFSAEDLGLDTPAPEEKSSLGFDASGLDQYENGNTESRVPPMIRKEPTRKGGGAFLHSREHKSRMINGGS